MSERVRSNDVHVQLTHSILAHRKSDEVTLSSISCSAALYRRSAASGPYKASGRSVATGCSHCVELVLLST